MEADGGSAPNRALGANRAAVRLDQVSNDREPESRSTFVARASRVDAIESLEDSAEVLGRNAAASVSNHECDATVRRSFRAHRDSTARRMPHSVLHQVAKHLTQCGGIGVDAPGFGRR